MQKKAWLITAGVLLALAALLAFGVDAVFRRGSHSLEEEWIADCVSRIASAQTAEVESLERAARDYANWIDTYEFIDDATKPYVEQNLLPSMFANLQLDGFLLFHRDGRLRLGRTYDAGTVSEAGVPELTEALTKAAHQVARDEHASVKGLIRIGQRMAVFAVLPVLHDDGSGPPNGALAEVRFLNKARVARLRDALNLDLWLHAPDDGAVSATERQLQNQHAASVPRVALSDRVMELHLPIAGPTGDRIAAWHVRLPRRIHLQGIEARLVFYIVLSVLVFAAAMIIGWLFRSMVILRLESMHQVLRRVGATSDLSERLPLQSSDELTSLANDINRMFTALQQSNAERIAAEQDRERARDRLQQVQKMEALGTLAGGLAHDFNNLVTSIQGSISLIRLAHEPTQEVDEHLIRIEKAAKQAANLVRQMAAVGRRSPAVFCEVHVYNLVHEALNLVRSSVPRGIAFRVQNKASDDLVSADAAQLQQVLINLVTNASHAMAGGNGTLTVTIADARLPDGDRPETASIARGDYVRLVVADEGCGIRPEHLTHVFDPFFTTKPVGSGTGLGLAVAHGIVTNHRGTIGIASEVGRGTSVFIHLPRIKATAVPAHLSAQPVVAVSPRTPGRSGARVLLVDDDSLVRDTLQAGLRRAGYEVLAAENGPQALRIFEAQLATIDALVTDQMMPGMTGMELGERGSAMKPGLARILITGYAAALDEQTVKASGFAAMLMKPVTMAELDETLQQALRRPAASRVPIATR